MRRVAEAGRRVPYWGEAVVAAVLAALAYFALHGELPYHDAQRFTNQVTDDVFVWDIGHILLQPAAVLLHRASGADPNVTLKALSSLATAAAIGLFHLMLRHLGIPAGRAVLGTLLLAGCCSVLTLAPSAHPKLVAFPFINAALLCLCLAEQGGMRDTRLVVLGGALLALAAGFLASALATPPFAALAVLLAARRGGAGWATAFWRGGLLAATSGAAFLVIACAGYVALTGEQLSLTGLAGSVAGKSDLRPPPLALVVQMARVVFGTINNLVAVPDLGATVQAGMRGQIASLRPYAALLPIVTLWLAAALLIGAIYLQTAMGLLRGRRCLAPAAFLAGAQSWTIWYGLNDPEHWFALTAPSIVLFLMLTPVSIVRVVLPGWAVVEITANLAFLAIPVATYPLARNEALLANMLSPADLLVLFVAYPGRASAAAYTTPGIREYFIDQELRAQGATAASVLRAMDLEVAQTLRSGGRVLVADILDPLDWEAPWMALLAQGVTKPRLHGALLAGRRAQRLPDLGGVKLWELWAEAAPGSR